MRNAAIALIIFSALWGLYALSMPTTVKYESTYGAQKEVFNFARAEARRTQLYVSGFLLLSGVALFGFSSIQGGRKGNIDQLPKSSGAELYEDDGLTDMWSENSADPDALLDAVGSGNTALVRKLVEAGADINYTSEFGVSALSVAKSSRNKEMVELLTSLGAKA